MKSKWNSSFFVAEKYELFGELGWGPGVSQLGPHFLFESLMHFQIILSWDLESGDVP